MKYSEKDLKKLKGYIKKIEADKFQGVVVVEQKRFKENREEGKVECLMIGGDVGDLLFLIENLSRFVLSQQAKKNPTTYIG